MESFVFVGDYKWIWIGLSVIMGSICWFILDYLFVHKTQYSIHRIIGLSDKVYKLVCLIFICAGITMLYLIYTTFFSVDYLDSKVKLHYLFPRPPVILYLNEIKSYKIRIPKEKNNRILYIITNKGRFYKSEGIEPKYHDQLNRLTMFLDKIIQENSKGKTG